MEQACTSSVSKSFEHLIPVAGESSLTFCTLPTHTIKFPFSVKTYLYRGQTPLIAIRLETSDTQEDVHIA